MILLFLNLQDMRNILYNWESCSFKHVINMRNVYRKKMDKHLNNFGLKCVCKFLIEKNSSYL